MGMRYNVTFKSEIFKLDATDTYKLCMDMHHLGFRRLQAGDVETVIMKGHLMGTYVKQQKGWNVTFLVNPMFD